MKSLASACGLVALALLAVGRVPPARADFYTLDGRYQCLERGDAVCGDARLLPAPAKHRAAPPVADAAPSDSIFGIAPTPDTSLAAPPAPHAGDPLHAIALRLQAGRPASGDLAALKAQAHRGNPRAIELLAWCDLNAIGTPPDAVEAYLLYGAAASASLPHARTNQAAIFERYLDPDQRQTVLNLANEGVALAQLPE
ncbi:MAG TPA: hypothetical protein VGL83_00805 [Stellaceae bacterium]